MSQSPQDAAVGAPEPAPATRPAAGPPPPGSARNASLVGAGILLSRVAGLVREKALAYFLGVGLAADAYRAALKIPNLIQNLLGEGVLSASFIPVYARLLDEDRRYEVRDPRLGLAPVAVVLGTAAFARLGLALAGRLRAVATLALTNALYLILLLIGGIVFPLDRLPGPLAAFARLLPSAALAELLRAALGAGTGSLAMELVVLTVWAVGAVALAIRVFR